MFCMFRMERYLNMLPLFIHSSVLLCSCIFFLCCICWKRTWKIANIESEWEIWMKPLTFQHYRKKNMHKLFFYLQNCTHTRGLTNIHSIYFSVSSVKLVLGLATKQEFYFVKKVMASENIFSLLWDKTETVPEKSAAKMHVKKSFPLVSYNSLMCSQGLLYCSCTSNEIAQGLLSDLRPARTACVDTVNCFYPPKTCWLHLYWLKLSLQLCWDIFGREAASPGQAIAKDHANNLIAQTTICPCSGLCWLCFTYWNKIAQETILKSLLLLFYAKGVFHAISYFEKGFSLPGFDEKFQPQLAKQSWQKFNGNTCTGVKSSDESAFFLKKKKKNHAVDKFHWFNDWFKTWSIHLYFRPWMYLAGFPRP